MPKSKKIKVAIFHNLPRGGAKRYLYEITKRLRKKYDIDEYKLNTSSSYLDLSRFVKTSKSYAYRGGKGVEALVRSIVTLPKVHKKIAKDINRGRYDLIITNHDYFTKSPYIHQYLEAPCLYICHEPQREFYEKSSIHSPRIKEKIMNILRLPIKHIDITNARAADEIIANSKYSKTYLKNVYGVKTNLVYPGVDNKNFTYSNKIKKENFVLAIGSLMPVKGHDFVIRSLGRVKEKYRPSLVIVGSANSYYKKRLIRLAKTNNVRCKILSKVTDRQIKKLYMSSLAYVSGAHKEPFGLCVLEAMSSGTPAIVIEGGGAGEQIIKGVNGFVVKRDENEFASKLTIVIKTENNNNFGIKARNSINKNWTWEQTIDSLDKIIKRKTKS